eukprot:11429161-Alexandrium_andersonii.AAC.1
MVLSMCGVGRVVLGAAMTGWLLPVRSVGLQQMLTSIGQAVQNECRPNSGQWASACLSHAE